MKKWMWCFGMVVLAAGLLSIPAPSSVDGPADVPAPERDSCLPLDLDGSLTHADPLNPDSASGTLDAGALSCSGKPRNC